MSEPERQRGDTCPLALNGLAVVFSWQFIPPNIFIIGLGLVVIGLALLWNAREDAVTS